MQRFLKTIKELFSDRRNFIYLCAALILAMLRAGSLYFYVDAGTGISTLAVTLLWIGRTLAYTVIFALIWFALDFLGRKYAQGLFMADDAENTEEPAVFQSRGYRIWYAVFPFVILALAYLVPLLIKYPAAIGMDEWCILGEFRTGEITEHHSVYYMSIFGTLVGWFEARGMANVGLFLFSFLNYAAYVVAFGYAYTVARSLKLRKKMLAVLLIIFCVNPYIIGFIGVIIKDTLYSAMVMLFTAGLVDLSVNGRKFVSSKLKMLLMAFSVFNIYLVRRNGKYLLFMVLLFMAVSAIKKKCSWKPVVLIVLSIICAFGVFKYQENYYDARPGSTREALSLWSQQTARYCIEYGDELTDDEKKTIDNVFGYDDITTRYDPRISDPTKGAYRTDATSEELKAYFILWFKLFFRHPLCYVQATLEQNYYIFMPEIDNYRYIRDFYLDEDVEYAYEPIFTEITWLAPAREWVINVYDELHQLPVVGLLWNSAFQVYVFLFTAVYLWKNRRGDMYVCCPMLATIIIMILGPVIYGFARYMLPMLYGTMIYGVYAASNFNRLDTRTQKDDAVK